MNNNAAVPMQVSNVATTAADNPFGTGVPPLSNPPGINSNPSTNTNIEVECKPWTKVSAGNRKFVSNDIHNPSKPASVNDIPGRSTSQSISNYLLPIIKKLYYFIIFVFSIIQPSSNSILIFFNDKNAVKISSPTVIIINILW